MAIKTSKQVAQKITISLPQSLVERLKAHVPPRQRSDYIARILEEQLALEEQFSALEETAGCWSDENHPDLKSDEEIDGWLADLRGNWQRQAGG